MTTRTKAPSKLEENVDIAEWPRNRKGQVVRVGLRPYNGHALLDVRSWWVGDDRASTQGRAFRFLSAVSRN
jgi:hypothetical protein